MPLGELWNATAINILNAADVRKPLVRTHWDGTQDSSSADLGTSRNGKQRRFEMGAEGVVHPALV